MFMKVTPIKYTGFIMVSDDWDLKHSSDNADKEEKTGARFKTQLLKNWIWNIDFPRTIQENS